MSSSLIARVDASCLATALRFCLIKDGLKWAATTSTKENPMLVRNGMHSSYYRPRSSVYGCVETCCNPTALAPKGLCDKGLKILPARTKPDNLRPSM